MEFNYNKYVCVIKKMCIGSDSPLSDKNEPSRFLGEGQSFKAKLIGILEVSEARGDRMCQEALADLKMAIRAAGEHKQRIVIHVAIDGLRLRDEKTGDSLYHHPVHKISFIAQDMSDSRAFGYIFGSPDTGHRFFGIKTDKAASQVVIAMRDLFQVVFELKKKEIELAKQHIEQKSRFGNSASSSLFSDSAHSITKTGDSSNTATLKMSSISETGRTSKSQEGSKSNSDVTASTSGPAPEAIADLVDLELELSSIQQGIHQMERITPSDPFGPNKDDLFHADPFGDSFTSFPAKPYLPPPPSSTKDRSARTASESSNLFSPQSATLPSSLSEITSKETSMFDSPTEDKTDWFSQPPSASSVTNGEITSEKNNPTSEQEMSQERKNSILAQFDVFTELDPLGTGRSKPYVDKKHFFQELKNPPKKVLKDLVGTSSQPKTETSLFQANFDNDAHKTDQSFASTLTKSFQVDPFADEDPFDKTDPFLEKEFKPPPQDPFNTDFIVDFKMYGKQELKPIQKSPLTTKFDDSKTKELIDTLKFPPVESILGGTYTEDNAQPLFSTSPNKSLEKQFSLPSSSPKSFFTKNTFDNKFESKKSDNTTKMSLLHENPSLDMSSESECAPEPPPRPMSNITPIKPPPLPPKKQAGELSIKPPPRPPHTEESHYDYIEQYESAPNSLDSLDKSPPLPIPARRVRHEPWSSGTLPPQRPRKYFTTQSSDEDYLTPIPPPLLPPQKKDSIKKSPRDSATGPMLLPPPQKKGTLKRRTEKQIVPSEPSVQQSEKENKSISPKPDIADITLTDLTRTGLDELAKKLNVPANQLSNMTLVQLTTFLSNHLSAANKKDMTDEKTGMFPSFKAEFSVNFSDLTDSTKTTKETYDRYAVFRELLEKDKNENSELFVNKSNVVEEKVKPVENDFKPFSFEDKEQEIPVKDTTVTTDRYAALREIIVEDLVTTENKEIFLDESEGQEDNENEINKEQNDLNIENIKIQENIQELDLFNCVDSSVVFKSEKSPAKDSNIIEYSKPVDIEITEIPTKEINKSPTEKIASPIAVDKSPVNKSPSDKSPVPAAITEIIQSSNHLTSGSLSDGVSGSSPEMDNLEESPEVKKDGLTTESWAIFDSPNIQQEPRDKQSEEGVSPWSSDSKEFVTASPTDWRQRKDSGSGGEQWTRRKGPHKDPGWWDEEVKTREAREGLREERERHRRSTDSYDEEFYEMDRGYHPRERRVRQSSWNRGQHSSSSRDVSPWEEEPCRDWNRRRGLPSRHSRDSWDEEDDYEFEEEQPPDHRSWSDRRSGSRERYSGRCADAWPPPPEDRHRTHRRRHRQTEADHHCCGDWEQDSDTGCANEKITGRYGNRYSSESWRERDRHRGDDRYYPRNWSQESPWEDEYSNDPDDPSPRYLVTKRTWKRPSSASEMDRKTGENKPRQNHYRMTVSGSDGERDRRYRSGRRARSRDSHYSESNFRHKPETSLTLRHPHRSRERPPAAQKSPFEDDFSEQSLDTPSPRTKYDFSKLEAKKVLNEKTTKDKSPKSDDSKLLSIKLNESDSNATPSVKFDSKFKFENDFSEIESSRTLPSAKKSNRTVKQLAFESPSPSTEKQFPVRNKNLRQQSVFENDFFTEEFREKKVSSKPPPMFENDFALPERDNDSPKFNNNASSCMKKNFRQESQFEDDFSPTEKSVAGGDSIGSITEETNEDRPNSQLSEQKSVEFSFPKNNLNDSKRLNKSMMAKRLSVSLKSDLNLKKSESVNIFARENDPFDDDFFSKPDNEMDMAGSVDKKDNSARGSSNDAPQWTEDFDCFVEES